MDQLAIDAKAATDLGMNYGDYIAKYKPPVPPAERHPKKKQPAQTPTPGKTERPRCLICGNEIPEFSRRTKTCSSACADARRLRQGQEDRERRRQKKLEAAASSGTENKTAR